MRARTFGLLETSGSLRGRGLEAIAWAIFIGNAPDGSSGSGEEQFLDGDSGNIDSKKIRDVVIALNEAGVQEEKNQKQSKIQSGETERADEHGGNQVGAEKGNHNRSEEHTSELQSHLNLVCRLLLEKKKRRTET